MVVLMTRPAHLYISSSLSRHLYLVIIYISSSLSRHLYLVISISQDGIQSEQRKELMEIADVSPEDQYAVLNPL